MLELFRKIRVERFTKQAADFLNQVYKPEPKKKAKPKHETIHETKPTPKPEKQQSKTEEGTVHYSIRHSKVDDDSYWDTGVRYSRCEENESTDYTSGNRYSKPSSFNYSLSNDNYDTDRISGIMRSVDIYSSERIGSEIGKNLNVTFSGMLKEIINKKNLRDSDVYKDAKMDRRLFSKIMSDNDFHPSKDTVLSLIFATRISLKEAEDLLSRAGYTLSHSSKRDVIMEYFIREGIHDIIDINMVLYNLGQKTIGR